MLVTKLLPPRYHHQPIKRKRLLDRLQEAVHQRLIYLKAPGGFGKTTLINQWRQALIEQGHKVGWVNLDNTDNEESQFLAYWMGALQQAGCDFQQGAISVYERGRPESLTAFMTALVNDLVELQDEIYLVLEDYHCIDNLRIHELIGQIIKYAPENFHLVISSRTDIPIALGDLHLRDQITELNVKSLRFSYEETHEFLAARLPKTPGSECSRGLHDATDGWIAGIQLLSMSSEFQSASFGDWEKGLYPLAQSILEQTLRSLPPDTQDMLLRLSVLDRFSPELCEEVLGIRNASQILENLASDGVLLVPLDHDERWYRFHALFSEHLRQRLAQRVLDSLGSLYRRAQIWFDNEDFQHKPTLSSFLQQCQSELTAIDMPSFHYRASLWFERKGYLIEAVHHALGATGEERAYELIDRCAMSVLASGDLNTVLAWAESIPPEELTMRWRLRLARFWAWVLGCHLKNARQELEELAAAISIPGGITAFEFYVCKGAFAALSGDIQGSLELLNYWPPTGDAYHNAVACNALIYSLSCTAQYEKIRDILAWQKEQQPNAMRGLTLAYNQSMIGWLHALKGDFRRAEKQLREALQRCDEDYGRRSTSACVVTGYLAELLYETNDLEALENLLSGRLDVMNQKVIFESLIRAYSAGARLRFLKGDDEGAYDLLERLKLFGSNTGLERPIATALAERTRMELLRGNLAGALELQQQLDALAEHFPGELTSSRLGSAVDTPVVAALSKARCALELDDPEQALVNLERLSHFTINVRLDFAVKIRLLRCMALYRLDDAQALAELKQLLSVTESNDMIRSYTDEGPACQQLLEQTTTQLDAPLKVYAEKILRAFVTAPRPQQTESNQTSDYNLSTRELDILVLLAQGMPNKRIASALNISAETVKWYLKKIFTKLNVSDRVHAIDKVRREGLVTP
ncbi:hypothetical protein HP532_05540 [Pseudomonas sp. CrR25]|nr:hypothetical protein [Pseudomonas sp. CrR25]